MNGNTPYSRFVIIKARVPDWYESADCAVVEVTEDLVLMLDKRMAMTKAIAEQDFYGTRWWDYSPYFVMSAGPDSFGVDMSEEDWEDNLDGNFFIPLPEAYKTPDEYAPIDTVILMITPDAFQWSGYDKHIGDTGRVTTYEMTATTVDEWAELIGCTEMLAKVRRCRGVKENPNGI